MRLDLNAEKKIDICKLMLEEVLQILSTSNHIDKIVLVSKDESAFQISKKFNPIQITDNETGVNNAVALADTFLRENGFDASIVIPQDIPFIKTQDIDFLMKFQCPAKFALIVPSRQFDGTNALVRMPVDIMKPHYDENSYKIHLTTGKSQTLKTSLVFVKRIMMDIDNMDDLKFAIAQNEKLVFCKKILTLMGS